LSEDRAALIERLRRSDIRIDREGQLWHEGQSIDHPGLRAALFRWLDRLPDGRYVFRLDETRYAYLDVEDTPLVARSLRWERDRAWLALSDGSEEALDPTTLTSDVAGVLRCRVRGALPARLSNSAAATLADRLDPGDPPRLRIGGQSIPIPLSPPGSPPGSGPLPAGTGRPPR
jgi:hypothetical protein